MTQSGSTTAAQGDSNKKQPPEGPTRGIIGARLFPDGDEPDARFTLANERTFLAWIRTSLALMAGGIGVEAFQLGSLSPMTQTVLACVLLIVGTLLALGAGWRWWRVETAMRKRRPLPVTPMLPLVGLAVATGAVVVTVLVISG